ncbi:MAG: hypothetical protein IPK00_27695 [Deltaproteobacteria bacterium]|nr:hypothetical protein [Deltaproteobacteria bacterium]
MRCASVFSLPGISLLGLSSLLAGPALAWDVSVGTNDLDIGLYVQSWSGPGFTWLTLGERVRAADQGGPTVPNNWTTQSWDDLDQSWPADQMSAIDGVARGSIYNDDTSIEFWTSGEAAIFGPVAPGDAVGAGVGYDFEFVVLPFTTANLLLDPSETYVFMDSQPGDVGIAFATVKLYSTDLDLNAPGGSNSPWAQDGYTLEAGGPLVEDFPTFTKSFVNNTSSPQTYQLRFEASASVFAVPEPQIGAAMAAGLLCLAGLRRSGRPGSA